MGQNIIAKLSEACLKSRRAGRVTGSVVFDQRSNCGSRLPSNISYYLKRVLGQLGATRKGTGLAMAQMPTRAFFLRLLWQNRWNKMNKAAQRNLRLIKILEYEIPPLPKYIGHKISVTRRKKKYSFRYFWESVGNWKKNECEVKQLDWKTSTTSRSSTRTTWLQTNGNLGLTLSAINRSNHICSRLHLGRNRLDKLIASKE